MSSSWKQLVTELKKITGPVAEASWETAKRVHALLKSKEFLAEACHGRPAEAESVLGEFAGKFGFSPVELSEMYNHFPKWEDWKSGRLDLLRDKTARAITAEARAKRLSMPQGKDRPAPKRRPPLTKAEMIEAELISPEGGIIGPVAAIPSKATAAIMEEQNSLLEKKDARIRELTSLLEAKDKIIAQQEMTINELESSLAAMKLRFYQLKAG